MEEIKETLNSIDNNKGKILSLVSIVLAVSIFIDVIITTVYYSVFFLLFCALALVTGATISLVVILGSVLMYYTLWAFCYIIWAFLLVAWNLITGQIYQRVVRVREMF